MNNSEIVQSKHPSIESLAQKVIFHIDNAKSKIVRSVNIEMVHAYFNKVFACEPLMANDAAQSYKTGVIKRFEKSPLTIADGTRTLSVSERTLQYIKKLDGFYEIPEEEIIYWTQWLTHLLKINLEPTCALGMAGAYKYIKESNLGQKILVIVSGGNVDPATYLKIWEKSYMEDIPRI
jgi:threonine dehydratase